MANNHTIAILGFNNHKLTLSAIKRIRDTGCKDLILFYDNGSNPSFEGMIDDQNIKYHRIEKNKYVNPAWNEIFELVDTKFLTLLNNDCFILSPDYFEDIIQTMEENKIGISSCKTKNILKLKYNDFKTNDYFYFNNESDTPAYTLNARRQGWLMTINMQVYKSLKYLIPNYLKLWYGDDWIWGQFIENLIKTAVFKNRYAVHIKNSTTSSKQMQNIITKDKINLEKYGGWYKEVSPVLHKRTRFFSRYL